MGQGWPSERGLLTSLNGAVSRLRFESPFFRMRRRLLGCSNVNPRETRGIRGQFNNHDDHKTRIPAQSIQQIPLHLHRRQHPYDTPASNTTSTCELVPDPKPKLTLSFSRPAPAF